MKKIVFWILLIIAVFLLFKIGRILIFDFGSLSEFGIGYLVGLIVEFIIIGGITTLLGFKTYKKDHLPSHYPNHTHLRRSGR